MPMGIFDGMKRRRAERELARLREQHGADLSAWQEGDARIDGWIQVVRDCINGRSDEQFTDRNGHGFMLGSDEFPVAHISGTALLQVVRAPGRYEGGYGGVSFPMFGGMRGHVGGQRGMLVKGQESQTVTDTGETMVTNERVMFRGDLRTEEWRFSRMMAMEHSDGLTVFSMNSRSKPSAIGYGSAASPEIQFRLEIAAALARETLPRLLSQLEAEKSHHQEIRPPEPA